MLRPRFFGMIRKEFLQLRRDRPTFVMLLSLPLLQLLIFGYAINTDVRHLATVVYDPDRSGRSREVVSAFQNTQYYDIAFHAQDFRDVVHLIDSGRAKVGLVFPPDFARRLDGQRNTAIQVIVDASDPLVATSAVNAASALGRSGNGPDVRVRAWYNPDLASAIFIVPGLLGALLMMTTITITAMALVRERERGTLEQLIVTPLKRWELILSKIMPYVAVGYLQMTFLLLAAVAIFRVPLRGSVVLLYVLTFFFMLGNLSLGILLSTVAKTQQQAMQMSMFIFLPSIYLSGLLFPVEGMPGWAKALASVIPLTYYLRIVRGILLKGIGLSYLWGQLIPLLVFGLTMIAFSIARFRKRLT